MRRAGFTGARVAALFSSIGATLALASGLTLAVASAAADEPEPASASGGAAAPDAGAGADVGPSRVWASCVERVPNGATRPTLTELFPARGFSGYAASLEVTVAHGKGETVLPEGLKVQGQSDAARALSSAGFVIPEPDAGAPASVTTTPSASGAVTKLVIPFVLLPKDPGRNGMVLPPVPIAVARASGEVVTICTQPHAIVVDDPIASELDPKVKPNPPPRRQREDWALARELTIGLLIGALLGGAIAYAARRFLQRPKVVAPPPPRLPWLVALEELEELRRSSLLTEGKNDAYFDRVSDSVRKYLGARYGFDGLETTTDEMRGILKRVRPAVPELRKIGAFLSDCDLVKFARVLPQESDCLDALRRGEQIVRVTIPAPMGTAAARLEEAELPEPPEPPEPPKPPEPPEPPKPLESPKVST